MARKCGCFEEKLSHAFHSYGRFLARHPFIIIFISLAVAAICSCGVVNLQFESNTEELFTPDVSRARDERTTIQGLFPTDFDNFVPSRVIELYQRMLYVIVTAKDGGNILGEAAINEAFNLREKLVTTTVVGDNDTVVTYDDLCARSGGHCAVNPVLQWVMLARRYNQTNVRIPYPSVSIPTGDGVDVSETTVSLEYYLGGVQEKDGFAESAKALSFFIYLRHEPAAMHRLSGAWEDAAAETLESFQPKELSVVYFTSDSIDEAQQEMAVSVMSYFSVTFIVLIVFAVASCMMKDWVLSKPWLASTGAFSAVLAISSCIGILSFSGVALNQVAASMPFLIVGIGLDDTFIMLAAWRKTSPFSSVEERMGEALSEAAVSITITTATDFLAFCAGSITPLPAVRVFCLCAGIAVVCDFFFQLTFFGAIMVLTGRREAANRHCYFCWEVLSREESPSVLYSLFCAGGYPREQREDPSKHKHSDHVIMGFFKDTFAPLVTHPLSMLVVAAVYAAYIAVAIYGCVTLEEGLEMENLAEEGSVTNKFFEINSEYFVQYGPIVSVMVIQKLDYSEPKVQHEIGTLVEDFEASPYSRGPNSTEFWFRDFLVFMEGVNATTMNGQSFNGLLRDSFLALPMFSRYQEDIVFDNRGEITASRFLIGTTQPTVDRQGDLMIDFRERADGNRQNLTVQVYAPTFTVFEQFLIVLPNTLQNLIIATLAMLLVSLMLIPNPLVSIVVTLCVVSIETGVVGFMSHWGVNLDGISMINIILCIGFSVDFSAHISYSFVTQSRQVPSRDRAAYSLYSLGYPIVQSALSTILGISALFFTRSYIFHVFAKVLFLVMTFGLLHGLLFLPVLLTVLGHCGERSRRVNVEMTAEDEAEVEKKVHENGNLESLMHIQESDV